MKHSFKLITLFAALLLSLNAQAQKELISDAVIGVWAMIPLQNGIANVVEFKANGEVDNHSFVCDITTKKAISKGVENSLYTLNARDISVQYKADPAQGTKLHIDAMSNWKNTTTPTLKLTQTLDENNSDFKLEFNYIKLENAPIAPLCDMFFAAKSAN